MVHNIVVEKFGIRLRPVTLDDAPFIFDLRRSPQLSKYIGEFDQRYMVHLAWLNDYFKRNDDYYFIIESLAGEPFGTIAVYDITEQTGNWGRWIIKHGIPVAPASAWLIYYIAFEILQLPEVYSNSVLENHHIVSFHDQCGLIRTRIEPAGLTIHGITYDLIIHTAKKDNWEQIKEKLETSAKFAERLLGRN